MLELTNRFNQIRALNDGLSTLMCLCMTVYSAGYHKNDIEEALKLVDKGDYRASDKEAIITALENLTKKEVKKRGKRAL